MATAATHESDTTFTVDGIKSDAVELVDKTIANIGSRELVGSGEAIDKLLDVRSLLALVLSVEQSR